MTELNHSNVKKEIFPIALLAAGRPCLVVGGGRVGLRKARRLLDSGADVTVITPKLNPELAKLAKTRRLVHVPDEFTPVDVNGFFLVFAATSDRDVNLRVLAACRERGIYACSVDNTWPMGDFVTPATARKDDVTVAVSTGGKSCRRAKMIKQSLARHLQMLESADLLVLGTSHEHLSIDEREQYHVSDEDAAGLGEMLMQIWGVHEFVILNTCNRVELHAIASNAPGVESIMRRLLGFQSLPKNKFYVKRGYDAFAHLNMLAAGLLSQTPGEKYIVAQVKNAIRNATKQKWAAEMMKQWYDTALHVSKDIRGETEKTLHCREVENLLRLYLEREAANWRSQRILVIGAGTIGRAVVSQLANDSTRLTWCYHTNKPKIPNAHANAIKLCQFNELSAEIARAEIVVCAAGGGSHVVTSEHSSAFARRSRPTLVVDLAMPRNVDPQLRNIEQPPLVIDLDNLKHWHRREATDMTGITETANAITAEHKGMYDKLINTFQGGNQEKQALRQPNFNRIEVS